MDLQFHLEAFEFMMILSFVNKKVDHRPCHFCVLLSMIKLLSKLLSGFSIALK